MLLGTGNPFVPQPVTQPVVPPVPAPRFGSVIDRMEQETTQVRPASSFDPSGMNPQALAALAALEQTHGGPFNITSAFRDPARNAAVGGARNSMHTQGAAFDINVRDMPIEQRVELIRQARAAGFTGIGVYNNSLHFDIGPERAWGPDFRSGSLPAWAREAVGAPVGADRTARGGLMAMAESRPADAPQGGGNMQQGGILSFMSGMNQPEQQQRRPSIWDRLEGKPIVGGLADPDTRARLAIALQGMTIRPNEGLIDTLNQGMQDRAQDARTQQAVEWLTSMGRTDLAQAVAAGALMGDQAAAIALAPPAEPDMTDRMQNYEYLLSQGLSPQEAMDRAFSGGVNVNVGTGPTGPQPLGNSGQILVPDETQPGGFRVEVAPGSEADIARQAAADQSDRADQIVLNAGQTVFEDTTRALEILDRSGSLAAGAGSLLSNLPATDARTLRGHIESIKGNIGIDQLLKIKESGAGLGAIPQGQLEMLAGLLGNLDQAQNPEELRFNLRRVQEMYSEIVRAVGGDPSQIYADRLERLGSGSPSDQSFQPAQPQATPQPAQPEATPQAAYTGPSAQQIATLTPEQYADFLANADVSSLPTDVLDALIARESAGAR